MGTLQTIVTDVRYKVRDPNSNQYTDAEVLAATNGILDEIYGKLVGVGSNLVYSHGTITLADGTKEYTPSFTHDGFLVDGVWIDGNSTYLEQVAEPDRVSMGHEDDTDEGEPLYYYFTEDGDVGFIDTPDDTYTVHVYYWEPLTALTAVSTDNLPFNGIFNQFIKRRLVMDLLERNERDITRQAALADIELNKAMNIVYNHGVRQMRPMSDMFTVDGI